MTEQRLARWQPPAGLDTMQLGQLMAASNFFSDTKDAAQAVVKILAGAELGLGPIASMTGIHIVQGRITLSANLIAAAIRRSGRYNYRILELSEQVCRLEFFEAGASAGVTDFTWKDAEKAQLAAKPIWKQYPRNMLFARAMSNGARFYCPDVFGGPVYTPEELGSPVQVTDDGAVEVAPAPEPTPPPTNGQSEPEERVARSERMQAVVAEMDAAMAEGEPAPAQAIEPVSERTRILCAAFVDAVHGANPKYKPKLPPDAAGDAAWLAWLEQKSAAWKVSELNPAAPRPAAS